MQNRTAVKQLESLAIAVAVLGALFKIMHWPGANIMLIVGLGSVSLCHLYFAALNQLTDGYNWQNYVKHYAVAMLLTGYLFKLMHWPGSNIMLIAGGFAFVASFVTGVFSQRNEEEKNKNP